MPIEKRGRKFLVTVQRAAAMPGFRRIRKAAATMEAAKALEAEIEAAVTNYGRWPAPEGSEPLAQPLASHARAKAARIEDPGTAFGTIRQALAIASDTIWHGSTYSVVQPAIAASRIATFLEDRGHPDFDDVSPEDLEAYVQVLRSEGSSPSNINHHLLTFRALNRVAVETFPPLASRTVRTPVVPRRLGGRWWLTPDDHKRAIEWLRDPGGGDDEIFADLIDVLCYQGIMSGRARLLTVEMVSGIDTDQPHLIPFLATDPVVPIRPEALPALERAVHRATVRRWARLFPFSTSQMQTRWQKVRSFLGATHIPSATLGSLHLSYQHHMNRAAREMPVQAAPITTPQAAATPLHGPRIETTRIVELVKAYAATGASPEAVGRFAKMLLA